MILRVMTKKNPYIIQILPDTDGFEIETDKGEEMKMQAVNENGKQFYRFGDWSDIDSKLNEVDKTRCGDV